MRRTYRIPAVALLALVTTLQSGCMTTGYSYARDPKIVGKWDVTITKIEPQNIYNSMGVALVGPFAKVESRGQRIAFIDAKGKTQNIVQPLSDRYVLHEGQHAVYIADRGQVWVQPTDYPLPPEFGTIVPRTAAIAPYESKIRLDPAEGWAQKPLTDQMKASGDTVYTVNVTTDSAAILGATRRSDITDLLAFATSRQALLVNNMKDAKASPITQIQVAGKPAFRFEVSGAIKANGLNVTFVGTTVAGDVEVGYLRAWTNTAAYPAQKDTLARLSEKVVGL
jgi:hypothetical protein